MHYKDIPKQKIKDVCHTMVLCEHRLQKEDSNRTCITLAGGHIKYPGDLGTPTGSLDLVNMIINSVLSRCNALGVVEVVVQVEVYSCKTFPSHSMVRV